MDKASDLLGQPTLDGVGHVAVGRGGGGQGGQGLLEMSMGTIAAGRRAVGAYRLSALSRQREHVAVKIR